MKTTRKYIVEAKVCGACVHYRQHYVLAEGGRFHPIWYGHCHVPRAGRYPQPDGVCPRWEGPEGEEEEADCHGGSQ